MSTILIVDDDRDILDLERFILESEGYRVWIAENGLVALDKIKASGLPDLIILDMVMPVMNGWEFAKALRGSSLGPVPIVVISAAGDAEERAKAVGAERWLDKPFQIQDLLEIVRDLTHH